jgi:SAM-dependent methyltransferase
MAAGFTPPPRYIWPKEFPPLTLEQQLIGDDFMRHWHEVLPKRYGAIERFNHTYPVRYAPPAPGCRTLEIGAGLGEHLEHEPLDRQEYHCVEMRPNMAEAIRQRFPGITLTVADCQTKLPYPNNHFDRLIAIHVLEHLPNLPAAIDECHRVLKLGGKFALVIPCDPGLVYAFARKISSERIFRRRYDLPFDWFIHREHINSPDEIMGQLQRGFSTVHRQFWPLAAPIISLNLCLGMTLAKIG